MMPRGETVQIIGRRELKVGAGIAEKIGVGELFKN
jgi:hypothetical protein